MQPSRPRRAGEGRRGWEEEKEEFAETTAKSCQFSLYGTGSGFRFEV